MGSFMIHVIYQAIDTVYFNSEEMHSFSRNLKVSGYYMSPLNAEC